MKCTLLVACIVLLGSVSLSGQQPAVPEGFTVQAVPGGFIVKFPPCPVSMQAKHGSDGLLLDVRKDGQPAPPPKLGQTIHLTLNRQAGKTQITGATVTAVGFSARGRIHSTSTSDGIVSDLRRTLDVTFSAEENGTVSADVFLPGFTAVNSVRLDSITYADGSNWQPSWRGMCSVVPDPLMLVAGW